MPRAAAVKTAAALRKQFVTEHPTHTLNSWKQAVVANTTLLSYWDWACCKVALHNKETTNGSGSIHNT